jgi:hypothetical protein
MNKTMLLRHVVKNGGGAAIHQAEVAGIEGNVDLHEAAHDAVEQCRGPCFEPGFTRACTALTVDDVGAFPPHQAKHVVRQFRRIPQVGVQHQDVFARRNAPRPGAQRGLMPIIARQLDTDDMGVTADNVRDYLLRPPRLPVRLVKRFDILRETNRHLRGAGHKARLLADKETLTRAEPATDLMKARYR